MTMLCTAFSAAALAGPAIHFSFDVPGFYMPAFPILSCVSILTMAVSLFAFRGAAREKNG